MNPIAYLDSLQGSGIRPGLTRMRQLLRAAGHPERAFRSILISGTNGKGSTSATLASILECAGYRTGLYTSPHLVGLRERWRVDRDDISEDVLFETIARLRAISSSSGVVPTYFEALTILAFFIFEREECEIAVLEVGMGGRLDATNVVRPIAALIAPIAFDHMEFLGRTVRSIAREKAGIIHRGCVAVTSNTDPAAIEVLARRCRRFDLPLHVLAEECSIENLSVSDRGTSFTLRSPSSSRHLETPLIGAHQADNVALAVRAAEELGSTLNGIDGAAIDRGVAETTWRGRLERFDVAGKQVWVDGAHNPHAAARVAAFVRDHLPPPRVLVLAIMADKDVIAVTRELVPLASRVIVTRADVTRGMA
ncbi:MAG TPA: folylpolyglutamate synthase/dihydrofolate synthase family protein, partial [Thermoanaerobaculia bacterium]|nr:folylpolyglutamate synthase/dihydrofolate synthase family protein [Thermoanaerobaculia bacterium]